MNTYVARKHSPTYARVILGIYRLVYNLIQVSDAACIKGTFVSETNMHWSYVCLSLMNAVLCSFELPKNPPQHTHITLDPVSCHDFMVVETKLSADCQFQTPFRISASNWAPTEDRALTTEQGVASQDILYSREGESRLHLAHVCISLAVKTRYAVT
jgi:hypothetical protein